MAWLTGGSTPSRLSQSGSRCATDNDRAAQTQVVFVELFLIMVVVMAIPDRRGIE
jgi:hypothetical protein